MQNSHNGVLHSREKERIIATRPGTNIMWCNQKPNTRIMIPFPFMVLPHVIKINPGPDALLTHILYLGCQLFRPRSIS